MRKDTYLISVALPADLPYYWLHEARRTVKDRVIILDEPPYRSEGLRGRAHHFEVAGKEALVSDTCGVLLEKMNTHVVMTPVDRRVKLRWIRYREPRWRLKVERFPNGGVDVWIGPWVWTNEWDDYRRDEDDE